MQTIEKQIQEINALIEQNNLEPAREQLHALIDQSPNDLSLRELLGEVYWKLENMEQAGQFWFLIEANTAEMVAATYAFANECNNDPAEILSRIDFKGDIGELDSEFAKYMLINLQTEANTSEVMATQVSPSEEQLEEFILPLIYEKRSPVRRTLLWIGCIGALLTPIVLLGFAFFGLGRWLVGLF